MGVPSSVDVILRSMEVGLIWTPPPPEANSIVSGRDRFGNVMLGPSLELVWSDRWRLMTGFVTTFAVRFSGTQESSI